MSLDNAFSRDELDRWAQRAIRELGERRLEQSDTSRPKVDGSAIDLVYQNGRLVRAAATEATGASGRRRHCQCQDDHGHPASTVRPRCPRHAGGTREVFSVVADFSTLNESLVLDGKAPLRQSPECSRCLCRGRSDPGRSPLHEISASFATASACWKASPPIGCPTRTPPWIVGDSQ